VSCINSSVCKLCRREGTKLYLKGERCYTDKCAFERREYPPGQHGQERPKFSEYALQLRQKQKTKRYYGVAEKQFRRYFEEADRKRGVTGTELLVLLETRLDNVVYSMGFGASRRESRQLVKHNHILVNGRRLNLPSYNVRKGDVIEVREPSRQITRVMAAVEGAKKRETPPWMEIDYAAFKGTVKDHPTREQITVPVEENQIVEYYSR
jgi:small subunit ribosomal protein S4